MTHIIEICKEILNINIDQLTDYDEPDEGKQMLQDLLDIIEEALSRYMGIVSIRD